MYNVKFYITIHQVPTVTYPNHTKVIELDFCESFTWKSSRLNMTDKGDIVLPRNLYYKDSGGNVYPLGGTGVNVGGFNKEPLFLRGDRIFLKVSYKYIGSDNVEYEVINKVIDGFISKVHSRTPIVLECEDYMFLLKSVPLPNRTFNNAKVSEVLSWVLGYVNEYLTKKKLNEQITVKEIGETEIGLLMVSHDTASQLLNRLNREYGIYSYFVGSELRSGAVRNYVEENRVEKFIMNGEKGNVCSDGQNLEYQRKDDIVLSAVAHNTITKSSGGTTKDGQPKMKRERLTVLVTYINGEVSSKVISNGEYIPTATEGERREFYFPSAKSTSELVTMTKQKLNDYFYDGLKGEFKTWLLPFMRAGDVAEIENPLYPEQNGKYRLSGVEYSGDISSGIRQVHRIDYKTT